MFESTTQHDSQNHKWKNLENQIPTLGLCFHLLLLIIQCLLKLYTRAKFQRKQGAFDILMMIINSLYNPHLHSNEKPNTNNFAILL